MKLNRKWILVASLVLSLAMATGSTLAYMTKTTETLTNTFTLGNVNISLTEEFAQNSPIYPGSSVEKKPTIENTGVGPAWVWMDVEIPTDVYPYIILETVNENDWTVVKNATTGVVTLMYNTELAAGDTATPFTSVKLADNANLGSRTTFDIKVTGYAIQDSFGTIGEAYEAFYNGEAPATMPASLVVTPTENWTDGQPRGTITVNDANALLYLSTLNSEWVNLYSNGLGTRVQNYKVENNGAGENYYYKGQWEVKLGADIDLGNKNVQPINLSGWGSFNGNGHTIKNARITTDSTAQNSAGLFATARVSYKDLTLENIHVKGSLVGNSNAGVLTGDTNSLINNITIKNSSVSGGKYSGLVVGYSYGSVTNCTVENSSVAGGYKLGGIVGYICASGDTPTNNVTNNTLTNCTVELGTPAEGKTAEDAIIGKVVGNYNCNGTCNSNNITNMTTSATANIGKIEANMQVTQ